ncbi:MAG: fluoride efflux transporter CrcB [Bacteroidetes bacterium]|nr:fluoride efflux transporter CrcB [Bacteroidota bacterium]
MNRQLILIGLGGMMGSVARYLMAGYLSKLMPSAFPYGTFAVNIIGCLIVGIIYGLSARFYWLTPEWRFFLATGFCGGYTTFSSFAFENIQLIQQSNYVVFILYGIASFGIGLLAVFAGLSLTKI